MLCGLTQLAVVLRTLLDRLRNEITRLAAVRAFNVVAASALPLDLAGPGVLEPVTAELTSFLRKALRPLRLSSLLALEVRPSALPFAERPPRHAQRRSHHRHPCLITCVASSLVQAVVAKYGQQLSEATLASLTEETAGLIVDADLALAAQGLRTLSVLLRVQPKAANFAAAKVRLPLFRLRLHCRSRCALACRAGLADACERTPRVVVVVLLLLRRRCRRRCCWCAARCCRARRWTSSTPF